MNYITSIIIDICFIKSKNLVIAVSCSYVSKLQSFSVMAFSWSHKYFSAQTGQFYEVPN